MKVERQPVHSPVLITLEHDEAITLFDLLSGMPVDENVISPLWRGLKKALS